MVVVPNDQPSAKILGGMIPLMSVNVMRHQTVCRRRSMGMPLKEIQRTMDDPLIH